MEDYVQPEGGVEINLKLTVSYRAGAASGRLTPGSMTRCPAWSIPHDRPSVLVAGTPRRTTSAWGGSATNQL